LHGGNLNIASAEKKGTTVIVDLPNRRAESVDKQKPVAAQALVA
jgi:hypothetical protein